MRSSPSPRTSERRPLDSSVATTTNQRRFHVDLWMHRQDDSEWPNFISTAPEIAYAYVQDYLQLRPDVACESETLSSLASKRDIPADPFRQTIIGCNGERAARQSEKSTSTAKKTTSTAKKSTSAAKKSTSAAKKSTSTTKKSTTKKTPKKEG